MKVSLPSLLILCSCLPTLVWIRIPPDWIVVPWVRVLVQLMNEGAGQVVRS
jgi:hypothetical protein